VGTVPAPVDWRLSSRCDIDGGVEFARVGGHVGLRASRDPDVTLWFDADDWAAFAAGVRAGEFDVA
jgi:hypothetical protein